MELDADFLQLALLHNGKIPLKDSFPDSDPRRSHNSALPIQYTRTEAVFHQAVSMRVAHPVQMLLTATWGRVAKSLVTPLTQVPSETVL